MHFKKYVEQRKQIIFASVSKIISCPNQNILHSVIGNLQKVIIIIINSIHMGASNKGKEKLQCSA